MGFEKRIRDYTNACGQGLFIAAALLLAPAAQADTAAGKQIFESRKCAGCHQVAGPSDPLPVAKRSSIKGPPLWFAGSKFVKGWLQQWLANPIPIYRVKYGTLEKGRNDHPKLDARQAAAVGAYLESLVDPEMKSGVVPDEKLSRREELSAAKLFEKKQVCFGCHLYPSRKGEIGGFSGPSLVGAGARLNADWIYACLNDPVRYYPNGRMPVYGDLAFDPFSDDDFQALARLIKGY